MLVEALCTLCRSGWVDFAFVFLKTGKHLLGLKRPRLVRSGVGKEGVATYLVVSYVSKRFTDGGV